MTPDLSDDDKAILTELPLSPRIRRLKVILDKLDPPTGALRAHY